MRKNLLVTTLLTLALIISLGIPKTVYASELTENCLYLALGDSITEGDNSYVKYITNYYDSIYKNCITVNMGMSGCESKHIADALTNPSNEAYTHLRWGISQVDVITLDVGSNDILVTALDIVANDLNTDRDHIGDAIENMQNQYNKCNNPFKKAILTMQAMQKARKIHNDLYYGKEMQQVINNFETNFTTIVKTIKGINPKAEVYIGNLYNPYKGAESIKLLGYTIIDLESFTDMYVAEANSIISNNSQNYAIVDLYSTINNSNYLLADFKNSNYNPHPNSIGHKIIGNKFIDAMKSR